MTAPVRTIAPQENPVSLVEAKEYLRVDHDDDDAVISSLIEAATGYLDGWSGILGRALVTQTWRRDFAGFGCLRLPLAPVSKIVSIEYRDGVNAEHTLDDATYSLITDAIGPYVALNFGQSWPSVYSRADAVSVTFEAGYGDAADVPAPIKTAIMMLVGNWYENRLAATEGQRVALPFAVEALISPYRRYSI